MFTCEYEEILDRTWKRRVADVILGCDPGMMSRCQ